MRGCVCVCLRACMRACAFLLSLDTVLFLRLYSSLGSECVTADTDSFGLELLEALNSTIFMQTCIFLNCKDTVVPQMDWCFQY